MHVNMSIVYEYDGWQYVVTLCIAAHVISLHRITIITLSRCAEFSACTPLNSENVLATIEAKICGRNNYTPALLPQCI